MSEAAAPAAAPSSAAGSSTSVPSSSSSTPTTSVPSSPARSTTAELAQRLSAGELASSGAPTQETAPAAEPPAVEGGANWYEQYQDVHGVPVQDVLAALQQGSLPEALYDKLKFQLQDGDFTQEVDLNTLRNGAMMRDNYTRKSQALAKEREAFASERNELVNYLQNWKSDPGQLLYGLERLGMPVLEAAKMLAERLTYADQLNAAVPGSGDQWLEAQKQKAEYEDMKRQIARQQEMQQQQERQKRDAVIRKNLQDASVNAFKEVGLELEESSWTLYTQHVQALFDNKPADKRKLTRNDLKQAAQATKTQLQRYAVAYEQRKPAQAAQNPGAKLGSQYLDGGAPKKVPDRAPKPPAPKTTAEVAEMMRQRAGIRQR